MDPFVANSTKFSGYMPKQFPAFYLCATINGDGGFNYSTAISSLPRVAPFTDGNGIS